MMLLRNDNILPSASLPLPVGKPVVYQGRFAGSSNHMGQKNTCDYDRMSRVTEVKDPAGNVTAYTYDALNRLTRKAVTAASGARSFAKGLFNYLKHMKANKLILILQTVAMFFLLFTPVYLYFLFGYIRICFIYAPSLLWQMLAIAAAGVVLFNLLVSPLLWWRCLFKDKKIYVRQYLLIIFWIAKMVLCLPLIQPKNVPKIADTIIGLLK